MQDLVYTQTQGDEVEDLHTLLAYIRAALPGVAAVSSGAIASDYQRLRVEHVCARLGLVSLAYMWHLPQRLLLRCGGARAHEAAWGRQGARQLQAMSLAGGRHTQYAGVSGCRPCLLLKEGTQRVQGCQAAGHVFC